MRLPEQKLWDWMRHKLGGIGFVHRVENRVGTGTPDVYFSHLGMSGWIELKVLPEWPASGKAVRIAHWTTQQRNWATEHVRAGGGRTWLVLEIAGEVAFANAGVWAQMAVDPTQEEIRQMWTVLSKRDCSTREVVDALRRGA